MQSRDRGDQAQAQTVTGCTAARFETYKTFEDAFAVLFANAGTGIGDADENMRFVAAQTQLNASVDGGVLDGVVEQVGDCLKQ